MDDMWIFAIKAVGIGLVAYFLSAALWLLIQDTAAENRRLKKGEPNPRMGYSVLDVPAQGKEGD